MPRDKTKPERNYKKSAENSVAEISEYDQAMKIYAAMIDGKSLREVGEELGLSDKTIDSKLATLAGWMSQDLKFLQENWLLTTIQRTEMAIKILMAQIRKWDGEKEPDIDYRVIDKLESLIKTQQQVFANAGSKGKKGDESGSGDGLSIYINTIVSGGKLHELAVAREQDKLADHVMPHLQSGLDKNPEREELDFNDLPGTIFPT